MNTWLHDLEEALEGVRLTTLQVECPQGYYLVDLLIARAVIEPHALLRNERLLVDTLRDIPGLAGLLAHNNPDLSNWQALGSLIGSNDLALRTMAALATLRRGQIMTMLNIHQVMPDAFEADWETPTLAYATEMAGRGFLSLLDANLDPDPQSVYAGVPDA